MLHSSIYKNNKDKYIYIRIYFLGVKVNFAPVHTNRSDNFRSLKKRVRVYMPVHCLSASHYVYF